MRKAISTILEEASNFKHKKKKIEFLRKNDHAGLRAFVNLAFNEQIEWLLPEGEPPYKPCPHVESEGVLYHEIKKLYLFMKGGNNNLHQRKREMLFIQLLESVTPEDARLLLALKDKQWPYRNTLPKKIFEEAFAY
jgi:hypothetical protein